MSGEPKTLTLEEFLIRDNAAMRRAGCELAEAALRVIREYDGTHRLALAAAAWTQTIADEGGRGDMHSGVRVVARDEAAELRAENDEADEPAPPEPNPLLLLADAVEETIGQAMWGQTLSGRPDLNGREKVMALLEQVRRLAGGESEQ